MKNRSISFLLAWLLLALCSCSAGITPPASENESLSDASTGEFADTDVYEEREFQVRSFEIEYAGGPETCMYSDDWFKGSSKIYSKGLAAQSFALAVSAFDAFYGSDYTTADRHLSEFFAAAGFLGYRATSEFLKKPSNYSIGAGFAYKTVGKKTLIAVGVRGAGYHDEWYSNMDVGAEGDHRGFSIAADTLINELSDYIDSMGICGDAAFWICGYSRAAAVSNLLAARIIDKKLSKEAVNSISYGDGDVFAYCFEAPMGAVAEDCADERYHGIFNIINPCDIVCRVAPAFFGFHRYGVDIYLPSPMTSARYEEADDATRPVAGLLLPPFSVKTFGVISQDIITSARYSNYNTEAYLDDLLNFVGGCVPSREEYYAESEAICEFVGMINRRGFDFSGLSDVMDKLSVSAILDIYTAVGSGRGDEIVSVVHSVVGSALKDEETIRITENFIVSVARLFGNELLSNMTMIFTLLMNAESIVQAHFPDYCAALFDTVSENSENYIREYALIEFKSSGDIEVYADGVLSAKLDGSYRTITKINSALPYSVSDGGVMRVLIPNYVESLEIRITSKDAKNGQKAIVLIRDFSGAERVFEEKTFSLEAGKTFAFVLENPCRQTH